MTKAHYKGVFNQSLLWHKAEKKKKHWMNLDSQAFTRNKEKNDQVTNGLLFRCASCSSLRCHLKETNQNSKTKNRSKAKQFFETMMTLS